MTEKEEVETQSRELCQGIAWTTPLAEPCMAAVPVLAADLYFVQTKPCSSMK